MAEKKKSTRPAKSKSQGTGKVMVDGKPVLKEWEAFVKKHNIKTEKEFEAALKKTPIS